MNLTNFLCTRLKLSHLRQEVWWAGIECCCSHSFQLTPHICTINSTLAFKKKNFLFFKFYIIGSCILSCCIAASELISCCCHLCPLLFVTNAYVRLLSQLLLLNKPKEAQSKNTNCRNSNKINRAVVDIRLRSHFAITLPTSQPIIDLSNTCNQASAPVVCHCMDPSNLQLFKILGLLGTCFPPKIAPSPLGIIAST